MVDGKSRGQVAFSSYITRCCGLLICSWSWKLLLSFSVRSKLFWGIGFLHTITKLINHWKRRKSNVPVCIIPEERKKCFLKLQCFVLTCRSALTSYSWPRFHIHHFWTGFFKHTFDLDVQPTYDVTANTLRAEETPPSDFLSIPSRKGGGREAEKLGTRKDCLPVEGRVPYGNRLCKSSAGNYKSNIFTTLTKDAFQVITVLGFI